MKKAIVIGATGLVGRELIKQLTAGNDFAEVISLVRRRSGFTHPKLTEYPVDFDYPDQWQSLLYGDVLFSAMGTTRAKAGSKDAQYQIDFCYQYEVAKIAASHGVPGYVLISSSGANSLSGNFYLRMKGQLDDAVQNLPFLFTHIIRPGQLDGNRIEKRRFEKAALCIMHLINRAGMLKAYRPIRAELVAKAMIHASGKNTSGVYSLSEVFELANEL